MKITCSRDELSRAIGNVNHAISSRTTSKIMEGILFEINEDSIKMTGTDTTITIETVINVISDYTGSFVVPAKLISSIVYKLPEEEVILSYDDVKNKLRIKSGKSISEIICFDSDEFPKIKIKEVGDSITLPKEFIKRIIKRTAFNASSDDTMGIMTGVLLEIKNSVITMVGIDGFRLGLNKDDIDVDIDVSVVIPAKLIIEMSKIIPDDGDDNITMMVTSNKVVFSFDSTTVILNTLNGKFINYRGIISGDNTIRIRVKTEDLTRSIDRASLLASAKNNNLIVFNIEDDLINIKSLSDDGIIDETVEIIKEGDNIKIGFNAKYLLDILKVIDDEELTLNMKNNTSPCIISPVRGDKYLYLILPIRIA